MDTTSAGTKPRKRAPLLQARHFHRRRTELRETGLHFDRLIDECDRDHYTSLVEGEFGGAHARQSIRARSQPAIFSR